MQLDKVYVPVHLTEETYALGESSFEDYHQWKEDRRRKQRQRALSPWEAVQRFNRLVVLGDPGAGKTTYLAHLAFQCARREHLPGYTPIFIRFRDIGAAARLEDAFPEALKERNFPHGERYLERRLKAGRCLILLDGLDEVPTEAHHQQVIELVQKFADREPSGKGKGNIVVVSSRTYSYEHGLQLTGFTKTEVMEFDDPDIERFAYNWFGQEDQSPFAAELVTELRKNRRFLELARNPLLLLLITFHYERERNLPNLRAELYKHCIRTRITRWNTQRGTHQGRFGETDKWRMLRELALDFYRESWQRLLDEEELLTWLETFSTTIHFSDDTTPAALLDEVARTSGLIQEWAIGRYGFSHQTLQEYFAAEGVDRLGPEQGAALLETHLDEPGWKEIILLYCGLTDNADPLVRRILDRAERDADRDSKALWLLAGRCMAEGARNVAHPVRQTIVEGSVALLRQDETARAAALTPEESGEIIAGLRTYAVDLLPGQVETLLASDMASDALLAARLLPETAEPGMKDAVSRRMEALTRSESAEERRAAASALGRVVGPVAGAEAAAALLAGLEDPDPAARAAAARALGRLGKVDDRAAAGTTAELSVRLLSLYETDPAHETRHAALESLLALGRAADVDMVLIPEGEFLLGSAEGDRDAAKDEKPQRRLYLPAYFMDRTPVTNAQFRSFIEAGGYADPAWWSEAIAAESWKEGKYLDYYQNNRPTDQPRFWDDEKWNDPQQPVVGVSWYEALAYARWAGKRLPTEAEWEKAARGGLQIPNRQIPDQQISNPYPARAFPWGDAWQPDRCNSKETGLEKTTPVGQYSPQFHPERGRWASGVEGGDSPYGVVDMSGNVWEWCSTRWRNEQRKEYTYPYTPDDGREDLSGGDDVGRVLRGGSWADDREWVRCAARFRLTPGRWLGRRGFRCCATSSLSPGSVS